MLEVGGWVLVDDGMVCGWFLIQFTRTKLLFAFAYSALFVPSGGPEIEILLRDFFPSRVVAGVAASPLHFPA